MTKSPPPQEQTSIFDAVATIDGKKYGIDFDIANGKNHIVRLGGEVVPVSFSSSVSRVVDPETVSEAIARPFDNASDEWKKQATEILHTLCQNRAEFCLDDVADALKPIDHLPHEPRATGQLMRTARKQGWCRLIRYENSKRKSRHYGIISVDESLIHSASV